MAHTSSTPSIWHVGAARIKVTYQTGPDEPVMVLKWSLMVSNAGKITDYRSRERENDTIHHDAAPLSRAVHQQEGK